MMMVTANTYLHLLWPYNVGNIIILILQVKNLDPKVVK